jgi:drug/metabolite transporter (DMT)-like permease
VPLSALLIALAAAVLHAGWNVLLGTARDPEAATAVAFLAGAIAFLPVAVATWDVDGEAAPYMAASCALELAYLALLGRAYATGSVAVVYPVARGSAPVLVLAVTTIVLGVALDAQEIAAVVLVAGGVLAVRGLGRDARPRDALLGLAIGVTIAGYTIVDDHGLDHADALPYLEVVTGIPAVFYAIWIARRRGLPAALRARNSTGLARLSNGLAARRSGAARLKTELTARTVGAGLAAFGAYGLVLLALERANAAPVAAVRESSVVIVVLLAAAIGRERLTTARLAGAVAIVLGVIVLALP